MQLRSGLLDLCLLSLPTLPAASENFSSLLFPPPLQVWAETNLMCLSELHRVCAGSEYPMIKDPSGTDIKMTKIGSLRFAKYTCKSHESIKTLSRSIWHKLRADKLTLKTMALEFGGSACSFSHSLSLTLWLSCNSQSCLQEQPTLIDLISSLVLSEQTCK
jgi:hypothetical protein